MNIYPEVVANIQMSSLTGFLSIIMLVAIFLMLSISIINSCMSIMYILPEAMWTFMGAHGSQTTQTGRNMEDSVKPAFEAPAAVSVMNKSGEGLRRNAQENRSMRKQAQRSDTTGGAGKSTPTQSNITGG